jgi:hypothetical protein
VVRDDREHALEGDDRIVDAPAVQRGDSQQIVVLGLAAPLGLQWGELLEGLLRVARREQPAGALQGLGIRLGRGGEGRCQAQQRRRADPCAVFHGVFPCFCD